MGHGPLPHPGHTRHDHDDNDVEAAMNEFFSVVCRVHGARETLRISTSCFAAFPKKGNYHYDDTDYYDDDTDECDDDHDDNDYDDDEKIIINLPRLAVLAGWRLPLHSHGMW